MIRLLRRVRPDDIDDRKALPSADQQVDHTAVGIPLLGSGVNGLIQQVGEKRIQVSRLNGRQTGAIGHTVQPDALGLAQQALFGQHNIQHLVAGGGVGVIHPGGLLGLVQTLRDGCIGLQAAQVCDLHLQLMAFTVDDLYILPRDLVLLALAVIQQVEGIHLLLQGGLFEKLRLQIEQRHAVKLGQQ